MKTYHATTIKENGFYYPAIETIVNGNVTEIKQVNVECISKSWALNVAQGIINGKK